MGKARGLFGLSSPSSKSIFKKGGKLGKVVKKLKAKKNNARKK